MDKNEAMTEIVKLMFSDFGIFSAELLASMIGQRMPIVRGILKRLEDEGFLVKGFFMRDSPTVYWMLKEDCGKPIDMIRNDMFLLNTQDNLHVYLRDMIKRDMNSTSNVIFRGTKIIGSFKGKMTISGAKVEEFEGSPEAKRYLKEVAISLGVRLDKDQRVQEDNDWDVSEFFIKTNPGAI